MTEPLVDLTRRVKRLEARSGSRSLLLIVSPSDATIRLIADSNNVGGSNPFRSMLVLGDGNGDFASVSWGAVDNKLTISSPTKTEFDATVHISGGADVGADTQDDVPLLIGDPNGLNIAIDGNEVMWRNNGAQLLTLYDTSIHLPNDPLAINADDVQINGTTGSASVEAAIADQQNMLMVGGGMNTSSKFTGGYVFGSSDSAFTTVNPKPLAAIVGRALETYNSDDDTDMSIEFHFLANGVTNPGTGSGKWLRRMSIARDLVEIDQTLRLAAAGTAGNPSLGRTSDSDTGIYWPSANALGITAGGTACMSAISGSIVTASVSTATTSGYQSVYRNNTTGLLVRFTSSIEGKDLVDDIDGDWALETLAELRPRSFVEAFKPRPGQKREHHLARKAREADIQFGFIAEEAADVADGKLSQYEWHDDGTLKPVGWKEHDAIALAIAGLRRLAERVEQLEGTVAS